MTANNSFPTHLQNTVERKFFINPKCKCKEEHVYIQQPTDQLTSQFMHNFDRSPKAKTIAQFLNFVKIN